MYVPPAKTLDVILTRASHAQLRTHIRMLKEMYRRHYPVVTWQMIDFSPTTLRDAGEARVSGSVEGTLIDVDRGEAIPVNDQGLFVQPHGSPLPANAPNRKKYKPSVEMPVYFVRDTPDDSLTLSNKQGARNMTVFVLAPLADELGVIVNEGDAFMFGGSEYSVKEAYIPENAYWQRFTNIPMYIRCEASLERRGS